MRNYGIGTKTTYVWMPSVDLTRKRCYSCNHHVRFRYPNTITDFIYKGNLYCDSCFQQVSHGIELPRFNGFKSFVKICSVPGCKNFHHKRYDMCFIHAKAIYPHLENRKKDRDKIISKIRTELERHPRPQDKFVHSSRKNNQVLKKEYGFCANSECPKEKKPIDKKEMFRGNRGNGLPVMYFCSPQCKFITRENNPAPEL